MSNPDRQVTARERRSSDPDRLLTLTDGVFAIIITILVLDIEIPELASGQSLSDALSDIAPTLTAFIVSFLLVGMYWVWHRGVFTQVQFIDRNATWLNLLFLLPVSLIPFAASTLGEHSGDPTALHIHGAVLITATLMGMPLLSYLHHHLGLMWETSPQKSRRLETAVSASPLIVYVIAMLMASSRPTLSLVLYFLLPILYFALVAFLKADPRTKAHAEDLS